MKKSVFLLVLVVLVSFPLFGSQADALSIKTDKQDYYYGDYLTIIIQVDELAGEFATMFITDNDGKSSAPLSIPVIELTNTITAPFPFESQTYPEGTYTLDLEYNNKKASTQFSLEDSGMIVVPVWIKDVGKLWLNEEITDGILVKTFTDQKIITLSDTINQETINEFQIPTWFKQTTAWWAQGMITDNDFVWAMEHLIKIGVIGVSI